MSKQSPLEDKIYKLTPYPSQQKGQEHIRSGIFSMSLSIFLLLTVMEGDWFTVLIAVYFLIVSLQLILTGTSLKRMPDRSRAVRVGPHGLYKMIEGSDVAQLPMRRIKALWKDERGDTLWLCTQKGAQRFTPSELRDPREWSNFVTHLERSLSHCLWKISEDLWRDVQANSHRMKGLMGGPSQLARLLVSLTALSIPVGAALVTYSGVSLEQLISGYPEVSFMLLGGSASWLNSGAEWGRLFVGPWMHFDLIKLGLTCYVFWWSSRLLGRIVGHQRVLTLVFVAHLLSALTHHLSGLSFPLLGAFAPQVALLVALWMMLRAQPPGLDSALGAQRNTLLWLAFAHVLIFSVFPEQALKALGLDLTAGALIGWVVTKRWSLEQPLWRTQRAGGLWETLCLSLVIGVTLIGFVSYTQAVRRPPLERLDHLTRSAPVDPVWNAQIGQMCAVSACAEDTRSLLQARLTQDAAGSPLSPGCHPRTLQTHLSQLQLSLAQDLSQGTLSQRSIELVSSSAVIVPSAPFATLLLSALNQRSLSADQALAALSAQRPSPLRLKLDALAHYTLSPTQGAQLELDSAPPLKVRAPDDKGRWFIEWDDQRSAPTRRLVQTRLWLLIGEGAPGSETSRALISMPLSQPNFTFELKSAHATLKAEGEGEGGGLEPRKGLWVKVLSIASQPSAAKSQRALIWKHEATLTP